MRNLVAFLQLVQVVMRCHIFSGLLGVKHYRSTLNELEHWIGARLEVEGQH